MHATKSRPIALTYGRCRKPSLSISMLLICLLPLASFGCGKTMPSPATPPNSGDQVATETDHATTESERTVDTNTPSDGTNKVAEVSAATVQIEERVPAADEPQVVPAAPDMRLTDHTIETRTHWDGEGRYFFEYPTKWQVAETQDKVVLTAVPSNGFVVSVDFHSPGRSINPTSLGYKDTSIGVCQVYMRDAVQSGRPTRGPQEIKIPGADDAAWAAWEWNGNVTEFVIFRVGGDYKKLEFHYLASAAQFREQALTLLKTLRIKNRPLQIAGSAPPIRNVPQAGTADEGYVTPSQANPRHVPATVPDTVGNPESLTEGNVLRAQQEVVMKAQLAAVSRPAPDGTDPKTGEDRFDKFFEDNVDLIGGKDNLTQEFARRYPDKVKDKVIFAEFIEKQPIVTALPKVEKESIKTREATQISLSQYLEVGGNISAISDKTRLQLAMTSLFRDGDASQFSVFAKVVRNFDEKVRPLTVPLTAVPYQRLVLGYSALLASTFDQIADYPNDKAKALVALRQLDAIDRKYYPLIVKERTALAQSIPSLPRFTTGSAVPQSVANKEAHRGQTTADAENSHAAVQNPENVVKPTPNAPTQANLIASEKVTQALANAKNGKNLLLDDLSTLAVEDAAVLAQYKGHLNLNGLTTLSEEAAQALAKHKGGYLSLYGLKTISIPVAQALAQYKGGLTLGLTTLPEGTAKALANHADILSFKGLTSISEAAAYALAEHHDFLILFDIATLPEGTAKALANHKDGPLSLNGLTTISDATAEALAQFKGRALFLGGQFTLSDGAAQALAAYKGSLSLNDLTTLTEGAATGLAKRKGGHLSLNGIRTISVPVAQSLAQYDGNLSLNGLTTLSEEAAQALAKHKGSFLSLNGLLVLPDRSAMELAKYKGERLELNGFQSVTSTVAESLAHYEGALFLNGLKSLPEPVAQSLAKHKGKELSLDGLVTISDGAATALSGHKGKVALSLMAVAALAKQPPAVQSQPPANAAPQPRQFDPRNFQKTKEWVAAVAAKEFAAEKLGNGIIAKEAKEAARAELKKVVGGSIRWTFHVKGIGESGFSIQEQHSFNSYLDALSALTQYSTNHALRVAESGRPVEPPPIPIAVLVDLDSLPHFTHEQLRKMRPGDPIEITGKITHVDLGNAPGLTTFKITVGSDGDSEKMPADSQKSETEAAVAAAERLKIERIMATNIRNAHSPQLEVAHTNILARDVPTVPALQFSDNGETVTFPQIRNGKLTLVVANLSSHQIVDTWAPNASPTLFGWSNDSTRLAYVDSKSKLHVVMDWNKRDDKVLPVNVDAGYTQLIWTGNDKLAFVNGDTGVIYLLDLNSLQFELIVKQQPKWRLYSSEFNRRLRDFVDTSRDHPYCEVSQPSYAPIKQFDGAGSLLFVGDKSGLQSHAVLRSFNPAYFRFSRDLRHILACHSNTLTHHFIGRRREPMKYFRIDVVPSQFEKNDKAAFDRYTREGRQLWGDVYSPLVNPLNGRVLGPDRQLKKGLVRVQEMKTGHFIVANALEVTEIRVGDIVANIRSDEDYGSYPYVYNKDGWYPLLPDPFSPVQRAFWDLDTGGVRPIDNAWSLEEIRQRCTIVELYLDSNGGLAMTIDDQVSEFQPGETPEAFADSFTVQYRTTTVEKKNSVLVVFSYGNARLRDRFAVTIGLPLAIERMRADVSGRARFGYISLGHIPRPPDASQLGSSPARSPALEPERAANSVLKLPGSLDDVVPPRPGLDKTAPVKKSETQRDADGSDTTRHEEENLHSQLSESKRKLNAAEGAAKEIKSRVDAAHQEISSLKKQRTDGNDGATQAGHSQVVMKPPRRVFGITAKQCNDGIHILSVTQGGAATHCKDTATGELLQMEVGDHIVAVNGIEPKTLDEFLKLVAASDQIMTFVVKDQRHGKHRKMTTTLD